MRVEMRCPPWGARRLGPSVDRLWRDSDERHQLDPLSPFELRIGHANRAPIERRRPLLCLLFCRRLVAAARVQGGEVEVGGAQVGERWVAAQRVQRDACARIGDAAGRVAGSRRRRRNEGAHRASGRRGGWPRGGRRRRRRRRRPPRSARAWARRRLSLRRGGRSRRDEQSDRRDMFTPRW